MKLKKLLHPKSFLNRMFILMSLAFVFLLIVFSLISYFNLQGIVSQNVTKNNRIILNQIKYNIENINSTIRDMCNNLYTNGDVAEIMYDDVSTFETIEKMQKAANSFVSSSFVDSVSVYNGSSATLYTLSKSIRTDKDIFTSIIKKKGIVPKLKPFVMEIKDDASGLLKKEKVLTYCLYQYTNKNNIPEGALLVNVKVSWLVDNIKQINLAQEATDNVYIFNNEGDFLASTLKDGQYPEYIKSLYADYTKGKVGLDSENGSIIRKVGDIPYIITFLKVDSAGIILLKTQEYDKVFNLFTRMKITLVVITFAFLIVAFLAVLSVSSVVYKPLGRLVSRIGTDGGKEGVTWKENDEITYLEKVYSQSRDRLIKFETDKISKRNMMKEVYLKKLLTENFDFKNINVPELFVENCINLKPDGPFAVCILRMDNYTEVKSKYKIEDINLIKFAILNISGELLSSQFRTEGVELEDDKVAVIINVDNIPESLEDFYNVLAQDIKQSQSHVMSYFGISISATVSEWSENIKDIPKLYTETQKNSEYRLVHGKASLITPGMVKENNENYRNRYSFDFERKLTESIKSGSRADVENVLSRFISDISRFEYKSIIISMMSLIDIMEKSMHEINKFGLEPVYIDFTMINRKIFDIETLEEFSDLVKGHLWVFCEKKGDNLINDKHVLICENVKQMISSEFSDKTLCLASIAATLKMSSGYLGQIFKGIMNMSIGEYINEVRLGKTVEWLEKSDLSVNEILERVGVENKTYFYSIFKKKYGVTPKEYKLQKSIKSKE